MCISVVACDMLIDVPHNCLFYPENTMYFYWSLAGSLAILFYCIFFFSAFTGNCASGWSLATGSKADVLVTCMVVCAESGVLWKSLVLEESIQLHQVTWASTWSLAINFNGNQGGRLSSCRR